MFDSPLMSLNSSISCRDCHLDEFSSTDGLPNAVGAGASGTGRARMHSGGEIIPRNVLPLWGRGNKGFETFFWDGKVQMVEGQVISQYGELVSSNDPMVVAALLPSVEIREMLADGSEVRQKLADEDVATAAAVQEQITKRFVSDADIGPKLAQAAGKQPQDVQFLDVAQALAAFIRHEFRIRPTKFHRFVFDNGPITQSELNGGILFYGRGRCVACHNGPYFTDFQFHAVAFPQVGFGKNGFGIDEGRYNVTLDPKDRFLFRTPPLYNVAHTGPYSHSGSVNRLEAAIIAHFDPLRLVQVDDMNAQERTDLLRRLGAAGKETLPSSLTDEEVGDLSAFLETLSFSNR